jgi:acetyl esterase/lipase
MALDPYLDARLGLLAGIDNWGDAFADPEKLARLQQFDESPGHYKLPDVTIENLTIPGPHGPIPVRLYRNLDRSTGPGLVWAHGGGFMGGDLDMNEAHVVGAELAARSGGVVLSVDYRLAQNGVRYPVPLDDLSAVWVWFADHATDYRIDRQRLFLGGASAGANLATGTVVRMSATGGPSPAGLLLAYPLLHCPLPPAGPNMIPAVSDLPAVLRFSSATINMMIENYVGSLLNIPDEAMPGNAKLDGFPTTYIVIAECDDLRASAEKFLDDLNRAGVDNTYYLAVGMPHGHLNREPTLAQVDASLQFFADRLGTPTR